MKTIYDCVKIRGNTITVDLKTLEELDEMNIQEAEKILKVGRITEEFLEERGLEGFSVLGQQVYDPRAFLFMILNHWQTLKQLKKKRREKEK